MSKSVESTRRELFEEKYPPTEGVEWNPHNKRYEAFTAFDRSRQHSCDWQNDMLEVFNAALDAVQGCGYQIVPIVPTEEMLSSVTTSKHPVLRKEVMKMAEQDYKLMLSNAPDYLGIKVK